MAAVDEEGSSSEKKNDDPLNKQIGKQFSTMHQEFENKLTRSGISYEEKVNVILSGWDRLAGSASSGQIQFATFLYRWTLQLVLQGEWPKLENIVKTRLKATLQRCTRDPVLQPMCCILLPLVFNPWGHPTLKAIFNSSFVSDEEAEQYIEAESLEVIRVRISTLVESRCEELALSLLKVCMRCLKLQAKSLGTLHYTQEDHNHFFDLYFVLLYKFNRKQFMEEVRQLDLADGVDHVRRLLAQQEKGRVWKHRLKIAEYEIQIFLASCFNEPYEDMFSCVFCAWCDVMKAVEVAPDLLAQMVHKYLSLAESSSYIYTMASVTHQKFGESYNALVTELLIRALTTDLNSLEAVKLQAREDGNVEEQTRLQHQMANGFMDLSVVFIQHVKVARECVLTAFSLHPTHDRLSKLREFVSVPTDSEKDSGDIASDVVNSESTASNATESANLVEENSDTSGHHELCTEILGSLIDQSDCALNTNAAYVDQKPVEALETDTCQRIVNPIKDDTSDNTAFLQTESAPLCNSNNIENSGCHGSKSVPEPQNNVAGLQLDSNSSNLSVGNESHNSIDTNEYVNNKDISSAALFNLSTVDDEYPSMKIRDEDESMESFFASVDDLIKQLHQEKLEESLKKEIKKEIPGCDILTAPQEILNSEKLGISKELCDDLAVVLSSPRWQVLTWVLDRNELLSICEKYISDSDSAKNLTKELKFLNIDYDQFKHLPSSESDEYTGIEKGYEHFVEEESDDDDDFCLGIQYSSGSEAESCRRNRGIGRVRGRRGRPPLRRRFGTSDSDSVGRSINRARAAMSYSDSDDSDSDIYSDRYDRDYKSFEGKRVTAVSCNDYDRRKRLRVDAATGRVKQSRGVTNHLRMYRHSAQSNTQQAGITPRSWTTNRRGRPPLRFSHTRHYAPSLGSLNLNPTVVLTNYNQTPGKDQIKKFVNSGSTNVINVNNISPIKHEINRTFMPPKTQGSTTIRSFLQSDKTYSSWKYAGCLVSGPNKGDTNYSSIPVASPQNRCSYRTREGRVVTLNTQNYCTEKERSTSPKTTEYFQKICNPSSKYDESFQKFLLQQETQSKSGKSTIAEASRKNVSLESNLEYLKRQGTSVIFKNKSDNTSLLANAQKNVLTRIMAPENARHELGFSRAPNQPLPVRAIAMPVSHNPPNLPPNDKIGPVGFNRSLPKGTTVTRRPKSDAGAGPSGLNNGGSNSANTSQSRTILAQARPAISITPSSSFIISTQPGSAFSGPIRNNLLQSSRDNVRTSIDQPRNSHEGTSSYHSIPAASTNERHPPLSSATVIGSVSQTISPRHSTSSPGETQGGNFFAHEVALSSGRTISFTSLSHSSSCTTTTTVASLPGEIRAPSMLETLLRDRSAPMSPLLLPLLRSGSPAPTTTTCSLPDPIVVSSSAIAGTSVSAPVISEALNLATSHTTTFGSNTDIDTVIPAIASDTRTINFLENSAVGSVTTPNLRSSPLQAVTSIAVPLAGSSLSSNILSAPVASNVIISEVATQPSVSGGTGISSLVPISSTPVSGNTVGDAPGMHQLLVPAQLIQVQGTDGSTNLGIVHSGSLDLRLPPGTRVIKSSTSNVRQATPVQITQSHARPLNVLHNVKIVQNRQIVRTVVVPHSVALQSLGPQQTAQFVTLSQGPSTSNNGSETHSVPKIPSSQLHKMLGHNLVPGSLVIRAVRPSTSEPDDAIVSKLPNPTTIIHHTADSLQKVENPKEPEKTKIVSVVQSQEEGLAERLSRHYLKNALIACTSTQSVGTQTQTTAVRPVSGQFVNQVVMNHIRSSLPIAAPIAVASSVSSPSSLSLGSSSAVSSETLEQLREFESVFEKVSNKSVKESVSATDQSAFTNSHVSSEESMIAAQLLSMANETPIVTTASSCVCTVPATITENPSTCSSTTSSTTVNTSTGVVGTRLAEGTFITIPSTTQAGTLILVNPSVTASGIVTVATSGVQTPQPPPAASPALSSTSSHSSVGSSPSSSSGKSKSSKPKVSAPSTAVTSKPKTPPPPKVPPKPAVAKPQVEESDETKARIQAILDQYKEDLANTPQPQPAPRNRKNCPPPKNEGKSSSKKKSALKKTDGTASASPGTSDSGHLPSVSPSPAPLAATPSGEDSESSLGGTSTCSQLQEEKPKPEETLSPQILQGVVVSSVKVDGSGLGTNIATLPQGITGGRLVQLIRHGSKVTAIATRQYSQKGKATIASGGPPPNVTIQGRINMNELMENHLASLLAGGSAAVNQSSALITKLLQSQQQQQSPGTLQQVVVQTSDQGQQVIQQLSLQPVITTRTKTALQGHVISGRISSEPVSTVASSVKITHPQPPHMSAGAVSISPGTPQQRVSPPSTPSPAPDLPHTPSSFPTHDEDSNSSVQSHEGIPSVPLPPFFTLTKQFMAPPQGQQFREKTLSDPSLHDNIGTTQKLVNEPKSSSLSSRSQPFARSESGFAKNIGLNSTSAKASKSNISANVMLAHSAPSSPLVAAGDSVLDMSSVSEPSSLESSPSVISQRPPTLSATSEIRSSSLDSVKSDLSVEEVQIPPSPATLTKQLQNAYMTEAALSPAVSHSQLSSSSSYSSPTTVQDLTFSETHIEHRALSPNLGHASHTYSLASANGNTNNLNSVSNCNSANNSVIDNTALACLSSPSGDVYLDQAGVGLGLDSLPLVEGRPQSPSLSDLVPAVPLLSWSPRSADSIMGQSPSLNEALAGNMTLDVQNSEDSLCDSSSGFPGLFSMEGDGGSVSSSTSEDLHSNVLSSTSGLTQPIASSTIIFSVAPSHSQMGGTRRNNTSGKRLPDPNREQDHTISSTRCEDNSVLASSEIPQPCPGSVESDIANREDSKSPPVDPWRYETESAFKIDENVDSVEDKEEMDGAIESHFSRNRKKNYRSEGVGRDNKDELGKRRRNQGHMKGPDKRSLHTSKDSLAHNGYEEKTEEMESSYIHDIRVKKESCDSKPCRDRKTSFLCDLDRASSARNSKCEASDNSTAEFFAEDSKPVHLGIKTEVKSDPEEVMMVRQTRGSKRRSDSDIPQEEKRSRSSRARRSEPELTMDDDKMSSLDDCSIRPMTRSIRGRHNSGTSDSSSNYSIDRVSTPGPQDSPLGSGNSRRRKRRVSHDSSISSRDSSPLTVSINTHLDGPATSSGGIHTRRSSSRDHAKKTRCRCCGDQQQSSQVVSSRRMSGRVSRGSGPSTS